MKTQIIPIFNSVINQEEVKSVNAKILHSFLEVDTRFNDWISRRIKDYQFIENTDFVLVTQQRVIKNRGGDRRSKEYHITLDMAKELAMIERNEKGRQARKYFIECEKRLMQITQSTTNVTPNRELLPKMVYHNKSAHKPYRAYVYDMSLKREVSVGTFATIEEALDAQKNYFQTKAAKTAHIPNHGRWLVIRDADGLKVKNIDNYNCVSYTHFKRLQSDARAYADETIKLLHKVQDIVSLSHEFLYRLKVLEGDKSASRLATPLRKLIKS